MTREQYEATRRFLKSRGFRWTPSAGCWQAYRNNSARWAIEEIVKLRQ